MLIINIESTLESKKQVYLILLQTSASELVYVTIYLVLGYEDGQTLTRA